MSHQSNNNKRIAKNTLLLYFRMLFMMVVSLYTSRVILNALGVEDIGIYNVVGGVVTIQLLLSLIIVVLIESVGVWFLNAKMTIPAERMTAANWVLQFSIVTFVIGLISVPYNAAIIAHEKMSAFAYISILEAVGKLAIAFLIMVSPIDRLIFYAILMCVVGLVIRFTYGHYCKKHFAECTYHFHWDKEILKKMFGFAGWNFIGASAGVLRDQGVNVVINLFCGPTVNAAKGLATQVNTAINSFAQNFMTALNPQITKSYAKGDRKYMFTLLFQGARLSFFMLLMLSLPILTNTFYILRVWLKHVPDYTVIFVQLTLLLALVESISYPLITALLSTGKIKKYQLMAGGVNLLNLPLSYLVLRMGYEPYITLFVAIIIALCCLCIRLYLLNQMLSFPIGKYLKNVVSNILIVALVAAVVPVLLKKEIEENIVTVFINISVCFVSTIISVYFIGCTKSERNLVRNIIRSKILHGKK